MEDPRGIEGSGVFGWGAVLWIAAIIFAVVFLT